MAAPNSGIGEIMDISKLKVPDLKKELKSRGLITTGNKNELMERLQAALKSKLDDASAESVDDLDEDLLNDDDLDHDHLDGSESVLADLDTTLDVSPLKSHKRKLSEAKSDSPEQVKPKKVVLNRSPSITIEKNEKENGSIHFNIEVVSSKDLDQKKVVKLSELSAKERLEMRAKKFGSPVSIEAKKTVRTERFNSVDAPVTPPVTPKPTIPRISSTQTDVLKKRAERFGGSAADKASDQERLEKRKARFGVVTEVNGAGAQTDKAKQRLERFKTAVK